MTMNRQTCSIWARRYLHQSNSRNPERYQFYNRNPIKVWSIMGRVQMIFLHVWKISEWVRYLWQNKKVILSCFSILPSVEENDLLSSSVTELARLNLTTTWRNIHHQLMQNENIAWDCTVISLLFVDGVPDSSPIPGKDIRCASNIMQDNRIGSVWLQTSYL